MQYSVILPTLNENGHISKLIESIEKIFVYKKTIFEIIVIDDNSTDGTIETVNSLIKNNNKIKMLVRKKLKKNLAESINLGIKSSKYENIIWMDADFQHPPEYINIFIEKKKEFDAVICSRFLKESQRYFKDKNFNKDINENQSYFFNKVCKFILFKDITDYTSGFICINKSVFNNFKLKGFYGDYFVSLLVHLKKKNYKITEIPFKDEVRATGFSKTVIKLNFRYIYTCFRYFLTLIKLFLTKLI